MNTQVSDGELVRQVHGGDQAAFGALYDRWFARVYDYVLRMSRNPEDAADLVQDTFMRAMERLDQLENPDAFRGWLFAIARTQTLSRIDQRSRATPVSGTPTEGQTDSSNPLLSLISTDAQADPETSSDLQESADLVWEAAASLDERTYTVLDLHVRHGLDSGEIAEVLGTSKATASMLLNRMRTRVASAIGTYLLMRKGSRSCDDLDEIVRRCEIPPVSRADRRRVDRHARSCDSCVATRRKLVAPHQAFGAIALVAAPAGLHQTVRASLAEASANPAPPPQPPGGSGGLKTLLTRPRAILAVLIVAGGLGVTAIVLIQLSRDDGSESTSEAVESLAEAPGATGTSVATATPTPQSPTTATTADAAPTAGTPTVDAQPTATVTVTATETAPPPPPEDPITPGPTTEVGPPVTVGPAPPEPLPTSTAPPADPAPSILTFAANPSPATCEGPFIELSWTTENASGVSLAIDGPGSYGSYGPNGTAEVPFACTEDSHTYTLTATGPEGTDMQSIVVAKA